MSGTTTKEADARADKQPELSPEQVREINLILVRARQGDESVLPELQRVLDENPEIWVRAGNIAAHAQAAWLRLISGPDLLVRESADRYCKAQIREMVGRDASSMERLLAERVVLCRLQLSHAEHMLAQLGGKTPPDLVGVHEKRITACQKRLSGAVQDLARHQKVFGRSGQPIVLPDIAAPPVDVAPQTIDITPPTAQQTPVSLSPSPIVPQIDPASLDMSEEAIEARIRAEWNMIHGLNNESTDQKPRNGHNGYTNRLKGLLEPTANE